MRNYASKMSDWDLSPCLICGSIDGLMEVKEHRWVEYTNNGWDIVLVRLAIYPEQSWPRHPNAARLRYDSGSCQK